MKKEKLLPLDIQLFAEDADDSAANEVVEDEEVEETTDDIDADDVETEESVESEEASDTDDSDADEESGKKSTKDKTKEYSERLKKDREAIRKEIEDEQNERLERIARSRGFDSWEELEEYSRNQELEDLGVSDKDAFNNYINNVISNNPEILKAKKIIAEQERRDSERRLEEDVKEISKLDGSIKTVTDLINHPSYANIVERVKNGASVLDAYKLENFDALTGRATDAAVQHVYNNINNKSHMKGVTGSGTTDIVVPDDVYKTYKKNMPNWTDEQIKKHYAKEMKGDE